MLCDPFHRKIEYLRVSVTPHCNLRCVYCVPAMGCHDISNSALLSPEEILRVTRVLLGMGIRKVRITGGEPLVRPDLLAIAGGISRLEFLEELALSTNGVLLASCAKQLRQAGVQRVNISLDSLCSDKFKTITRGGDLTKVWRGIQAALDAGLRPVKLNVVLIRGFNDDEIGNFAALTRELPVHVRFIELMPKGSDGFFTPENFFSVEEAKNICASLGYLLPMKENLSGGPADMYQYSGAEGCIGFIGAIPRCFCDRCNRLRLTAAGTLRPCLDWEEGFDLRAPMRKGVSDEELRGLIRLAIQVKPKAHAMRLGQVAMDREPMCSLGG